MANVRNFIGIDVSKETFDVAYFSNGTMHTCKYPNTESGISEYILTLGRHGHSVLEATGVYHTSLAFALYDSGCGVTVLNPLFANRYAQMLGRRTKTDKSDAALLLDYASRCDVDDWKPIPEHCHQAKQLLMLIEYKNKERAVVINHLEAYQHSHSVNRMCLAMSKRDISRIDKDIKALEDEVLKLMSEYEQESMEILQSIPGIGKKTACVLLALTGGILRFENKSQLASYVGLCPRIYNSGTSVKGKARICKMGMGYIRKMLYLCALTASKFNMPCREMYGRLVSAGKPKKLALVAVARKLLNQVFALVKKREKFDENFISTLAF